MKDQTERKYPRVTDFRIDATPQEFVERLVSGGAERREPEKEGEDK